VNLLVICHGFPPYYGGAEHAAYYLAREAARAGMKVCVLTSDIGGRLPRAETLDGLLPVRRLRAPKRAWTRHSALELLAFWLAARRQLPRALGTFAPDAILAHFTLPAGAVAQRLAARRGVPYSVVLHGSDVPGYQPGRFGALYPLVRPWVRRVWTGAAHVVAVSEPLADLAAAVWPAGRIRVIHNGVDTERFRPASPPRTGSETTCRLVAVAQLIPRKGLAVLIEALARLPPAPRRRVQAEIYGAGPERERLERLARDRGLAPVVRFQGLATHERLPDILAAADVFVLPSLQEGLPLSLLEALACGLPAVAADVGGVATVLRHEANGLLVPPADPEALRAALERLLADPPLRRRLAEEARRTAERFAWPAVWERYRQLMAPPPAAAGAPPTETRRSGRIENRDTSRRSTGSPAGRS